jgi:hypothetical protein
MSSSESRRSWLRWLLLCLSGGVLPGCGTIFYPERRGQPAGRLDWKVVAFDAVGLVFFFVPGIIAFAVDFATGAIYLPPDYYGKAAREPNKGAKLSMLRLPRGKANREHIEHAVSQHTGREIVLDDGKFETRELENIGQFWLVHDSLADDDRRQAA